HVAATAPIRFDADLDAGAVVGTGSGRTTCREVADHVALHYGEPSALIEVRHRDADRRAVDHVVGDHRPLETELGVDPHLARGRAIVGDDLQIGRRIAAHAGERAAADAIALDDHVGGAEDIDAVAVLSRPAA